MLCSVLSIYFLLMSLGIFPAWDCKSGSSLRDLFLQDAVQLTQTQELLREVMTGLMQDGKRPLNYNQAWKFVKSLSRELKSWLLRRKQQKAFWILIKLRFHSLFIFLLSLSDTKKSLPTVCFETVFNNSYSCDKFSFIIYGKFSVLQYSSHHLTLGRVSSAFKTHTTFRNPPPM